MAPKLAGGGRILTMRAASAAATPKRGRSRKRDYARMHARRDIVRKYAELHEEYSQEAAKAGLGWEMCAMALVERPPVITEDVPDWESEFQELQEEMEYYEKYEWPEGIGPPHPSPSSPEDDGGAMVDFAPRTTAADESQDVRSMERSLPKSLYLVLQGQGP